jgi:hypothetical protein
MSSSSSKYCDVSINSIGLSFLLSFSFSSVFSFRNPYLINSFSFSSYFFDRAKAKRTNNDLYFPVVGNFAL